MSRGARLTILGLYEFNNDIFQGFNVPDGMDRETVLNEILLQCGNLELIYPSYNIIKLAISNWSKVELPIWDKLYKTEILEYNPIWNVDGVVVEKLDGDFIGSTKGYNETNWLDNSKGKTDNTITTTRTGNIGVTTTQKMITEEREVSDFSTVKYIVESFKKRFCIMIY